MFFTEGGSSDSTTTPTSQNQLVTSPPHHSRSSLRRSLISDQVEVAIFLLMMRLGAASPVRGISSAETQHSSANTITMHREGGGAAAALGGDAADDGAEQDGDEGCALHQRVARGQFAALQMIGQNAVFDRTEQRADHAEAEQRNEQNRQRKDWRLTGSFTRMNHEADHRDRSNADFDELQALRHHRLVIAVGDLTAERRQKEIGRDEDRARERDQRFALPTPCETGSERRSTFFRKLSLKAEKN